MLFLHKTVCLVCKQYKAREFQYLRSKCCQLMQTFSALKMTVASRSIFTNKLYVGEIQLTFKTHYKSIIHSTMYWITFHNEADQITHIGNYTICYHKQAKCKGRRLYDPACYHDSRTYLTADFAIWFDTCSFGRIELGRIWHMSYFNWSNTYKPTWKLPFGIWSVETDITLRYTK